MADLLEAVEELLRRQEAAERLLPFIQFTKHGYKVALHHRLICNALERIERAVMDRTDARLLVRMPPRGGKSEIVSRKFPAWLLGRHPELQVIATSYNGELAQTLGGDARNLMESEAYRQVFPDVGLRPDSTAKDKWNTKAGGSYVAAGVGGGITGQGAHVLIIDDPYKDAKEAWSATTRRNVWSWYTSAAYTRLMPGGAIVILLTSWHEDGLDNQVLREAKETGENWEVIDIPAIMEATYEGRHPEDQRQPGDSYWPEEWPAEKLQRVKKVVGPYVWSALYQQRAAPETGTIIMRDWLRYWQRLPDDLDEYILSADLAFKKTTDASRVALHCWARKGAFYYLVDRQTEVRDFVESIDAFLALWRRWPKARVKLIEDKANGPAMQAVLQKHVAGIVMVTPDQDKVGRLRAVAPFFRSGNVFIPDPAIHPWSKELAEELVKFPNSPYNDDTDATSQALSYWGVPGAGPPRWKDWNL